MHVVVPAFQPGEELVDVVAGVIAARPSAEVLVVDDGSGPSYAAVFSRVRAEGARVLRLEANHGKGFALRAAFAHLVVIRAHGPVVTADADGQHAVADILRVADAVDDGVDAAPHLVVGERAFSGDVPLRSRFGNAATRLLFRAATGQRLHDTQTGLRGFPSDLLPWLTSLRGNRYEYELVMLLHAAREGIELRSVPIATIYDEGNATSHFRPVADSLRIYAPLLLFLGSSLSAFCIDTAALLALDAATGSLLLAVVGARIVSATANFAVNRHVVFRARGDWRPAAVRYAALAAALLVANLAIITVLHGVGMQLLPAKLLTEAVLVVTSYVVHARLVFAGRAGLRPARVRPTHPSVGS